MAVVFIRSLLRLVLAGTILLACASAPDEEATEETNAAYSGPLPDLYGASAPRNGPRAWAQPPSEGMFGKNGYCGATAAANLLVWYGRTVSPRQAVDDGCWSFIGTRPSHLAAYLQNKHAELGCSSRTLDRDEDALAYLRWMIAHGHPVIIEYMVGSLNAHWVTVVGIRGGDSDARLLVMSDGGYYTAKWETMNPAWQSSWGGPFPHIVCTMPVRGAGAQGLTAE